MKSQNETNVLKFAKGEKSTIEGSKLFALLRLINEKGDKITTNDPNLKGLKALLISDGLYIAVNRKVFKNGCSMVKTYLLTTI